MKDMTLINVLLDRSGSMETIAAEAVSAFNHFITEQMADDTDYVELSLVQFDDQYEPNYIRKPLKEVNPLILNETYVPRGMTALFDAIGRSINEIGSELAMMPEEERPARVLFVILTDGNENASYEFSRGNIKSMISHQGNMYNWDFIFLAAGIDAFAAGKDFGMKVNKCASFARSNDGIKAACQTMSSYAAAYRSTGDTTMSVNTDG